MKKSLAMFLILIALIVTACGSASNGGQTGSATQSLSTQTELILGTLKLEGTDQALTKEQGTQLLPLWQTMRELQSSDTAAQEETSALLNQIKENMTSQQLQAIANMKLTVQDAMTFMQGQNVPVSSTKTGSGSSSQSQSFGGGPAGGPPGGGDPMGEMTGAGASQTSTPAASGQSATSQSAGAFQMPPGLMDALIKLLEKKAAS